MAFHPRLGCLVWIHLSRLAHSAEWPMPSLSVSSVLPFVRNRERESFELHCRKPTAQASAHASDAGAGEERAAARRPQAKEANLRSQLT